jgi:predicted small lipoprotein YifL
LLRRFLALIALAALVVSIALAGQTPTPSPAPAAKQETKQEAKPQNNKQDKDTKFTAEQIVESVILVYGTRPGLDQIRRNGVERGKITRINAEGAAEEVNYERRFVRGENLDKDKIRLDQKLPTMEYSLIFDDGKLWGVINGAAFTPKQEATASFISQHHHSIDSLLRYKECGSTITLVGKEQQKGLELYVIDLVDKEKRKTRFYISARSLRVLWLEYEEGNPGGVPVKYTRKFLDYRAVQQTLAPYRTVLLEDGRQSQETHVLTITYGVKVNDSIFKNPEG